MADLGWKRVEEPVYDGTTGAQIDDGVSYQFGAEIDGTWVPFGSRTGSYVDSTIERAKAAAEKEKADKAAAKSSGDSTTSKSS